MSHAQILFPLCIAAITLCVMPRVAEAGQCGDERENNHVELHTGEVGPSESFVAQRERAVGMVAAKDEDPLKPNSPNHCTASMVSDSVLLSQGHCGGNVFFYMWFNVQEQPSGAIDPVQYKIDVGGPTSKNGKGEPELQAFDYRMIHTEGHPGRKFGVLKIAAVDLKLGSPISTIHHPGGDPKRVSWGHFQGYYQTPFDAKNNPLDFTYATFDMDVESGSSGGPVFDESGFVIGTVNSNQCGLDAEDPNLVSPARLLFEKSDFFANYASVWTLEDDRAIDIDVSSEGDLYAVLRISSNPTNPSTGIYRYLGNSVDRANPAWELVSTFGEFTQVHVGGATVVGVTNQGSVWGNIDGGWHLLQTEQAHVAVGDNGDLWTHGMDGHLRKNGDRALSSSIGAIGKLMAVDDTVYFSQIRRGANFLYRHVANLSKELVVSRRASEFAVSPIGTVAWLHFDRRSIGVIDSEGEEREVWRQKKSGPTYKEIGFVKNTLYFSDTDSGSIMTRYRGGWRQRTLNHVRDVSAGGEMFATIDAHTKDVHQYRVGDVGSNPGQVQLNPNNAYSNTALPGSWLRFTLPVSVDASEVVAQLSTGTPGMALYAKFGGPAEPDDFDAQATPVGTTGLELTSNTSGAGEWHFLVVHEGPDEQAFTLTVQTDEPIDDDFEIVEVPNGTWVTHDLGPHEMRAFYMDVPPGQTVMYSRLQGTEGDAEPGSIAMYGARERLAAENDYDWQAEDQTPVGGQVWLNSTNYDIAEGGRWYFTVENLSDDAREFRMEHLAH